MNNLDLPQEDMEFLASVLRPSRDPMLQQHFDALEKAVEAGDTNAHHSLKVLLVAEATKSEFEAAGQNMMNDSVDICRMHIPEVIRLADMNKAFRDRLAIALQSIQRSAFTHGWIVRRDSETPD